MQAAIGGANIFFSREAPRYFSALTGMIVCYCAMIALGAFLWTWMWWQNKRRDKAMGVEGAVRAGDEGVLEGFRDGTDLSNKYFRYAL